MPAFLAGLAGSVHCIGMCGGIVGALSAATPTIVPARRVIAIAAAPRALSRVLAYNGGRLATYTVAGALAGGVGDGALALGRAALLQQAALWLASVLLIALGLYLMQLWSGLARIEAAGQWLWRRLRPQIARLLPMDSGAKALALGALWGGLPCAMIYSMLLTALLSGSALAGAGVMLAFGLGTLPALTALGLAGARLRRLIETAQQVRLLCGALVLAFGLLGCWRAFHGVLPPWLDALCPGVHA